MSTSIENLRRVAELGLSAHQQIVDAYIALGYSIDKIAEAKGFYQPDSADVLHGYGFKLGPEWGDEEDDIGRYRKMPQALVNEYVRHFFPGIDEAVPQNRDITMEQYMDIYHPNWRAAAYEGKTSPFGFKLSNEENEILKYGRPLTNEERKKEEKKKDRRWLKLY